jgi:Zn-dependent protease with chaperone function
MRRSLHPLGAFSLSLTLLLPTLSPAQERAPSDAPYRRDAGQAFSAGSEAPVPPGLPTTPDNIFQPTEEEVRLGRKGSKEVEDHYKLITSGPYYERLQRVAAKMRVAALDPSIVAEYQQAYRPKVTSRERRVPFEFIFKVVDERKEPNAFSLPGGPIYVTRAMMDYTASDDELASVLAHECVHAVFHHMQQMQKKAKKGSGLQLAMIAAIVAAALTGGAAVGAIANVAIGTTLVQQAAMSGYSQDLESEADRVGIHLLALTPYRPVAMYTMMQRLQTDEALHGNPKLGVYQDHPYTRERLAAIMKELTRLGYDTSVPSRRMASGDFRIQMLPTRVNGREAVELRLAGKPLFTVAAGEGGMAPPARAEQIARQVEAMFVDRLDFNDVKKSPANDAVLLKGLPVIRVYPEDAAVLGTAARVTDRAYEELRRALWRERLVHQ